MTYSLLVGIEVVYREYKVDRICIIVSSKRGLELFFEEYVRFYQSTCKILIVTVLF